MHIWTHLKPESAGQDRPRHLPRRHGRARRHGRPAAQEARRSRHRRQHDRHVHDRQRRRVRSPGPTAARRRSAARRTSNWEGGYRVPALVRWPGVIKPGTEINDIVSPEDWLPTLMAAAGEPDITQKLLNGYEAGDKTFKVHLDGYDQRDLLAGGPDQAQGVLLLDRRRRPRRPALRPVEGGVHGAAGRGLRRLAGAAGPAAGALFSSISAPTRSSEPMHESGGYEKWYVERMFVHGAAQAIVAQGTADLQGLPAAPEAGQLLSRRRAGQAPERRAQQQLTEMRAADQSTVTRLARSGAPFGGGRGGHRPT